VRAQTQARIAFVEGPPELSRAPGQTPPAPDDTAGLKDRAARLQRIQEDLESTLFSITHEGTLDDTSEVWDLIPMMEFLIENTTDPNRISFLVTGVYKFPVGVRRSGSTDTITSADLSLRKTASTLKPWPYSASGRGPPSGRSSPVPWIPGSAGCGTPARG
jgi:hypothetical protein